MRRLALVGCLTLVVASSACYHATIETGATPSPVTIERSFASGWIYGLVPPSITNTAAKCPNGVAKVETQQSFVNGLVAFLTLGIYTPMSVRVVCATQAAAMSGPVVDLDAQMPEAEAKALLEAAAAESGGEFFISVGTR